MPKYPFKFPVSGREIFIKKVAPKIADDIGRSVPRPKPPVQEVKLGDEVKQEPNFAHPEYTQALLDWDNQVQTKTMEALVSLGVKYSLTEEDREELADVQKFYEASGLKMTGKTDLENWILYVAAVSREDYEALIQEVLSLSAPTPKSN